MVWSNTLTNNKDSEMTPVAQKDLTVLQLPVEEIRSIVTPIGETALFVMDLQSSTKRQAMVEQTARLTEAKRKLADALSEVHGRPYWPERFFNFAMYHNLNAGWFDLNFSERTPSKEGAVVSQHRVRLLVGKKTVLEKFVAFAESHNPRLRGSSTVPQFDLARELIAAMGI